MLLLIKFYSAKAFNLVPGLGDFAKHFGGKLL